MSQVEIYQSTDKQTQVHVTFEDESIHGTSGTLAPKGVHGTPANEGAKSYKKDFEAPAHEVSQL